MNKEELKARVCEVIRRRNPDIVRLGHAIFAEPELGFKEQKTSAKVRAALMRSAWTMKRAGASLA